jgi:para-aminobenzoate synthetase/4-amino-4-deoxychorismate lyase
LEIKTGEVVLHDNTTKTWLYFKKPHAVITTNQLNDISSGLQIIEELVTQKDWHAAGFLSYESAPAFDRALSVKTSPDFPLMWFGLYDAPEQITLPAPIQHMPHLNWTPSVTREEYNSAIASVKKHIAQGDTYQVNYTMRLHTSFTGDIWSRFLAMVQAQGAGYSAYLDIGTHVIASASPELFFAQAGETLTCRPMKGTVKRGRTNTEDNLQAHWLEKSEKNRAENIMIVDMIRNDLGRIAKVGSVRVPILFATERYPTLWQMTSTVTANSHAPFHGILEALFPCASITGAPKVNTMKIIAALENGPRRIYTGSIGFVAHGRRAQFNVAIRTLLLERATGQCEYGVGGGIVWDSISADEYEETLLKARVLSAPHFDFQLLETLRWTPDEGYYLLEQHINRILESAHYFGFQADKKTIESYLQNLSFSFSDQSQRVRLLLTMDSVLSSESMPMPAASESPLRLRLAPTPINSADVFLFHKTTRQTIYEQARASAPYCDDVLLFNERGEMTESTIANLVVELNGELLTPPLDCGLLPGTLRDHLLKTGQVKESIIKKTQLKECTKIYLVNSVRGWCEAILLPE